MSRFREITVRDLRRLNGAMADLGDLPDLAAVERTFLQRADSLLPGSCICWNNWTLNMGSPITCRANPDYAEAFGRWGGSLNAFVGHHPIAGAMPLTTLRPQRMSDFQTAGAFRENPLFREVYRHLESRFQLAYTASSHADGIVLFTWNRQHSDFTERDRDLLHLIGRRVDIILRRLEERRRLERACAALQVMQPVTNPSLPSVMLAPDEGRILGALLSGSSRKEIAVRQGWRRDTLDKRIATIRDRMGFENTGLLLSELARASAANRKFP